MVMLGDVLGLGRVGSGSGLDLRPSGSGGGISFVLVTHAGDSFVLVTPYIWPLGQPSSGGLHETSGGENP